MANSQRLSPLDASFLYYEKPNRRLHVGCVAMLDGTIPFGSFVEAMADRLGRIARYHQRPVRSFLDLRWPSWEDDPTFDVRHHVRHVGVPAPGDDATFHALVDTLFATALDPERPLWETYLIDGLAGGRSAVLCKIHHAMIDGVSGAQLLEVMSDPVSSSDAASGNGRQAPAGGEARPPSRSMLHPAALLEQARDALRAIGTLATFVREPGSTLPFNAPITDARRIVWASFPLDDFLAARGVAECKVNDVVLAVVAGALRRWLIGRGITTEGLCVRTLVPMSIRGAEHHLALGNLVTAMVARLPIDVADPRERLRRVTEEMRTLKEEGQPRATGLALQLASWLPPAMHAVIARLAPPVVPLNTVTTNVPGPRQTCRLLGRRIDEVHPIVPLYDGMGIEFAIMSYANRLSICAVADPHLVPEAAELEAHLHAAADELAEALGLHEAPAVPAAATPMRVAELMTASVVAVAGTDSLEAAWQLMRTRGIRHLPVVALDGRLVGLITHRDLLAASPSSLLPSLPDRLVAQRASARVADVMETRLSVATPDEPAAVAGDRMLRHKIGCLPVVNTAGRLAGIVTVDDFLRWATMRLLPTEAMAAPFAQRATAAG